MDWVRAVQRLRSEGRAGVLVTVVEVRGHAPRDPGAKLVVAPDAVWGSVGGGDLEETAIERARGMLEAKERAPREVESRLNAHARHVHGQQCCGGVVRLLLEPLPALPTIAVFGLGHVGYELGRILSRLPVRLVLVDSRERMLDPVRLAVMTEGEAEVTVHRAVAGEEIVARLPAGSRVLLITHDHAEDLALCDAALRRDRLLRETAGDGLADGLADGLGGIGVIGSRAKWRRFEAALAAEGHGPEALARVACPIGLPEVTGKEPAAIAVSVAAEMLRSGLLVGSVSSTAAAPSKRLARVPGR